MKMKICVQSSSGEYLTIIGYSISKVKRFVTLLLSIISLGGLQLILYWKPVWRLKILCNYSSPNCSDYLLIKYKKQYFVVKNNKIHSLSQISLPKSGGHFKHVNHVSTFNFFEDIYFWDEIINNYINVKIFEKDIMPFYFYNVKPLSSHEALSRQLIFGNNLIHVKVMPFCKILFYEVITPFNVFQILSIILWFNDEYELYSSCILVITLFSILISTYQIQNDQIALKNISHSYEMVEVLRDEDDLKKISSVDLIPGDIIKIIPGTVMACDAVLIAGSCILDESLLTGESFPVTKSPINRYHLRPLSKEEHGKNILYCGTCVLQTRVYDCEYPKAVVIRTGYQTYKGEIIKGIRFAATTNEFHFERDCYKFVAFLFSVALVGFVYTLILKIKARDDPIKIMLRTLDIVTIVVPPTLPAAMAVGIIYSHKRLKSRSRIFSLSPAKINVCGVVNTICFDKTGTLTENDLDIKEFVLVSHDHFRAAAADKGIMTDHEISEKNSLIYTSLPEKTETETMIGNSNVVLRVRKCMAVCHSLVLIPLSSSCQSKIICLKDKLIDGQDNYNLMGDPLELTMFERSGYTLIPDTRDYMGRNKSGRSDLEGNYSAHEQQLYDELIVSIVKPEKAALPPNKMISQARVETPIRHSPPSITPKPYGDEIAILKQFPFLSSLQCMSVITRELDSPNFVLYSKGAPEKLIYELCISSTVPDTFHKLLDKYTTNGYRVLALAYKSLDINLKWAKIMKFHRDELERDLIFLGLVVFENKLKPNSRGTVECLKRQGGMDVFMVTGDNLKTAIYAARQCSIIEGNVTLLTNESLHKDVVKQKFSAYLTNEEFAINGDLYESLLMKKSPLLSGGKKGGENDTPSFKKTSKTAKSLQQTRIEMPFVGVCKLNNGEQQINIKYDSPCDSWLLPAEDGNKEYFSDHPRTLTNLLELLIQAGRVKIFARMSPKSKAHLVEILAKTEIPPLRRRRYLMMCGDGANDCNALKQAHAGVALASSPRRTHRNGVPVDSLRLELDDDNSCNRLKSSVGAFITYFRRRREISTVVPEPYPDSSGCFLKCRRNISGSRAEIAAAGNSCLAAPFVSLNDDVSCVIHLIREGRCSLVTSFGLFKFMAVTSLVQFASVLLLHWTGANLSDRHFIYVDLGTITVLAILYGRIGPPSLTPRGGYAHHKMEAAAYHEKEGSNSSFLGRLDNNGWLTWRRRRQEQPILTPHWPDSSLITGPTIFSVLGQTTLHVAFLTLAYTFIRAEPWFVPYVPNEDPEEDNLSHETTAVFLVSVFQYVWLAIVFYESSAHKFRKPLWSITQNTLFLSTLLGLTILAVCMTFGLFPSYVLDALVLNLPPVTSTRVILFTIAMFDLFLAILLEKYVINQFKTRTKVR